MSINVTLLSRPNTVCFTSDTMLHNLLARVLPQEHDRKVVVRARHRYEHPSVLHGDKHKKHHGTHGLSKYVNMH
jgi:hypothetical protein